MSQHNEYEHLKIKAIIGFILFVALMIFIYLNIT